VISRLKEYEKKERYLASILFNNMKGIKEYSFTEGHICYDFIVTTETDKIIIGEIKVRNNNIDKYPDYILQVDKLHNLIKRAEKYNYDIIYYINFFKTKEKSQKDFIIFNLSERIKIWYKTKPKIHSMLMNAETFRSNKIKVYKDVILLKYDEKIDAKGNLSLN